MGNRGLGLNKGCIEIEYYTKKAKNQNTGQDIA